MALNTRTGTNTITNSFIDSSAVTQLGTEFARYLSRTKIPDEMKYHKGNFLHSNPMNCYPITQSFENSSTQFNTIPNVINHQYKGIRNSQDNNAIINNNNNDDSHLPVIYNNNNTINNNNNNNNDNNDNNDNNNINNNCSEEIFNISKSYNRGNDELDSFLTASGIIANNEMSNDLNCGGNCNNSDWRNSLNKLIFFTGNNKTVENNNTNNNNNNNNNNINNNNIWRSDDNIVNFHEDIIHFNNVNNCKRKFEQSYSSSGDNFPCSKRAKRAFINDELNCSMVNRTSGCHTEYCCKSLKDAINDRCIDCTNIIVNSDAIQCELLHSNAPYLLKKSIEDNDQDYFEFLFIELKRFYTLVNYIFYDSITLFQVSLKSKSLYFIHHLLSCGADINCKPVNGKSSFEYILDSPPLLRYLLDFLEREKVPLIASHHSNLLHICINNSYFESLQLLLEYQNFQYLINGIVHNNTPLSLAYNLNRLEFVKYLLEKGASAILNHSNETILQLAVEEDKLDYFRIFIQQFPELINHHANLNNYTLAHSACARGHHVILKEILAISTYSLQIKCTKGFTPFELAVSRAHLKCIDVLLDSLLVSFDQIKRTQKYCRNPNFGYRFLDYARKLFELSKISKEDFQNFRQLWIKNNLMTNTSYCRVTISNSYNNTRDISPIDDQKKRRNSRNKDNYVLDKLFKDLDMIHRKITNTVEVNLIPMLEISIKNEVGKGNGVFRQWQHSCANLLANSPLFQKIDQRTLYLPYFKEITGKEYDQMRLIGFFASTLMFYNPASFPLSSAFFNHILDKEISPAEVISADVISQIESLRCLSNDDLIAMDLNFTVYEKIHDNRHKNYKPIEIELKENGASIAVTKDNLDEYINLYYLHYTYGGCRNDLLNAFSQGFCSLINSTMLSHFTTSDILEMINSSKVNLADWMAHTKYRSGTESSEIVQWFWEYVLNCIDSSDQSKLDKLMVFCTGSATLPVGGFALLSENSKFPFRLTISNSMPSDSFPTSQTCFYTVNIPAYKCKEQLFEKFDTALLVFDQFHFA